WWTPTRSEWMAHWSVTTTASAWSGRPHNSIRPALRFDPRPGISQTPNGTHQATRWFMTSVTFKTYEPSKTPEKTVWYQIGLPSSGQALYQLGQEGVPYTTYTKLVELSGADVKKLSEMLAIPLTTVNRRAKSGRFSTHESVRIVQFVEVYEAAVRLFEGDR